MSKYPLTPPQSSQRVERESVSRRSAVIRSALLDGDFSQVDTVAGMVYERHRKTICNLTRHESLTGNPVRFGSGPAAVNGDEIRTGHCFVKTRWEGAESR